MSQIVLQDLTAIINGTSRYGAGYDTIHVETMLVTDSPLPPELYYYVPNGTAIPPEALALINRAKLDVYPMQETTLMAGTEDIQTSAQGGNIEDVLNDSAKLLLRSVMQRTSLLPVPNANNCYMVKYDYKLYPNTDGSFEFDVMLPFDGLTIYPSGGRVQVTVTTPIDSHIDEAETKGLDPNNVEIQEEISTNGHSRRPVVSFFYQQDPKFTIKYNYK